MTFHKKKKKKKVKQPGAAVSSCVKKKTLAPYLEWDPELRWFIRHSDSGRLEGSFWKWRPESLSVMWDHEASVAAHLPEKSVIQTEKTCCGKGAVVWDIRRWQVDLGANLKQNALETSVTKKIKVWWQNSVKLLYTRSFFSTTNVAALTAVSLTVGVCWANKDLCDQINTLFGESPSLHLAHFQFCMPCISANMRGLSR